MRKRLSAREKADLVAEYLVLPYGSKARWLAERGVSGSAVLAWKRAFVLGDLERGLVPRDTTGMGIDGPRVEQLLKELAAEKAARQAEQEQHAAEVAKLEAMNEALGKAIGLLHDRNAAQEPTAES